MVFATTFANYIINIMQNEQVLKIQMIQKYKKFKFPLPSHLQNLLLISRVTTIYCQFGKYLNTSIHMQTFLFKIMNRTITYQFLCETFLLAEKPSLLLTMLLHYYGLFSTHFLLQVNKRKFQGKRMDICLITLLLYTGLQGCSRLQLLTVPDEGSLLGLQTAAFSVKALWLFLCVCVCAVCTQVFVFAQGGTVSGRWVGRGEREREKEEGRRTF